MLNGASGERPIVKKTDGEREVSNGVVTAAAIQKPVEKWTDLEALTARVASALVALSIDEIDPEIRTQLKTLVDYLTVDRGAISIFSDDGSALLESHVYPEKENGLGTGEPYYIRSTWYAERLRRGETVVMADLQQELPEDLETQNQNGLESGVKSTIGIPLVSNGNAIGALVLDSFSSSRSWSTELVRELTRLAGLFAKILVQKKGYVKFKELFKFEKMLSEISSVFANLPAKDVDKTIGFGLERIGRFLNADRCDHAQYFRAKESAAKLYSWVNEGIDPLPELKETDSLFPWVNSRLLYGKIVHFSRVEEVPDSAVVDKESWRRLGTKSHVNVPISIGGPIVGALSVTTVREHRVWPAEIVQRLKLVGEVFANALVRKKKELEVEKAFVEIKELKSRLEADCTYLQEEIELKYDHHNMIGQSDSFNSMIYKINQIAGTDTNVLILGETGTGKEMVARAIHANSRRKNRPMVKVSCAALSSNLIESELFGHEKGAFTHAQERRVGRFELANGNTLFLDEIGELPIESQAKLLRVLQEGEFERLGSSRTITVDVRVVAATNRNLDEEISAGRFRQDLWYRLNVFPIHIPPLRDRKNDIPLLVDWFTRKFSKRLGKSIRKIPANVMKILQNYRWPGNIRELEHVIERAVINTSGVSLQLFDTLSDGKDIPTKMDHKETLAEIEKGYILQILEQTRWRVEGPKGAAMILELHPSTLRSRMRKLGISA